jgi:hypothetical protein
MPIPPHLASFRIIQGLLLTACTNHPAGNISFSVMLSIVVYALRIIITSKNAKFSKQSMKFNDN